MNTTSIGRKAEARASEYLKKLGYIIVDQNWRTRVCEIDIIAQIDETIYFVEVKYRRSNKWGGGLDYITQSKLKQMFLAAELWVSANRWQGDYCLAVVEVSGTNLEVTSFLTEL